MYIDLEKELKKESLALQGAKENFEKYNQGDAYYLKSLDDLTNRVPQGCLKYQIVDISYYLYKIVCLTTTTWWSTSVEVKYSKAQKVHRKISKLKSKSSKNHWRDIFCEFCHWKNQIWTIISTLEIEWQKIKNWRDYEQNPDERNRVRSVKKGFYTILNLFNNFFN